MFTVYYIGGPRDGAKVFTSKPDRESLVYEGEKAVWHLYKAHCVGRNTFVAVHESLL